MSDTAPSSEVKHYISTAGILPEHTTNHTLEHTTLPTRILLSASKTWLGYIYGHGAGVQAIFGSMALTLSPHDTHRANTDLEVPCDLERCYPSASLRFTLDSAMLCTTPRDGSGVFCRCNTSI